MSLFLHLNQCGGNDKQEGKILKRLHRMNSVASPVSENLTAEATEGIFAVIVRVVSSSPARDIQCGRTQAKVFALCELILAAHPSIDELLLMYAVEKLDSLRGLHGRVGQIKFVQPRSCVGWTALELETFRLGMTGHHKDHRFCSD